MQLTLAFEGTAARQWLADIGGRVEDPTNLLEHMAERLHDYEAEVFATHGFGRWAAHAASTRAVKKTNRMLVETGDLLDALTSVVDIFNDNATVSADGVDYAGYVNDGTGRQPGRNLVPEPPASRVEQWAEDALDLIIGRSA